MQAQAAGAPPQGAVPPGAMPAGGALPPPGADPNVMREMMGALEQVAGMIDQVSAENQQLRSTIDQLQQQQNKYDAQLGEVHGKSDMLLKMLKQPPAPGMM